MQHRWVRLALGLGVALAAIGTGGGAAVAASDVPPDASAAEACAAVFGADTAGGATVDRSVAAGEPASRDITWDRTAPPGPSEVLGCTAVDGTFIDGLSARARRVENDGLFVHHFSVPGDAAAGTTLCERGAVIRTTPSGGRTVDRLAADCLVVTAPGRGKPQRGGAAAAPAPVTPAPIPAVAAPAAAPHPAPAPSAPAAPAAAASPAAPSTAAQADTAPTNLPRTGATERWLTASAGALLGLGGLALAARPRRPSR